MSSELTVISPTSIAEAKDLATTLSTARTLPEALQKSPADILAIILAGAELGLAPMQSVRALVLIKGKPTLSADAMGALVKRRSDVCKWLRLVSSTPEAATYETQRSGEPEPTRITFTIQDAQRAGLNGDNWRKFPAAMLRARALTAITRAVYPDLILGVYDPDELAESVPVEKDVTPQLAPVVATVAPPKPSKLAIVDVPPAEDATSMEALAASEPPPEAAPEDPVELEVKLLKSVVSTARDLAELSKSIERIKALPTAEHLEVKKLYGARKKVLESELKAKLGVQS